MGERDPHRTPASPRMSDEHISHQAAGHIRCGLLSDKIALITGASRGIGAAAAKVFAREGASVVLTARTETDLKTIVEQIRDTGGEASYTVADFEDVASIERAVAFVVERHGRLDVAFNNAGVAVASRKIVDFSEADFDFINRVNYKGVFFAMAAEVRAIRSTAGAGAIRQQQQRRQSARESGTARLRSGKTCGQQPHRNRSSRLRF